MLSGVKIVIKTETKDIMLCFFAVTRYFYLLRFVFNSMFALLMARVC